jgi:hypothetical protein
MDAFERVEWTKVEIGFDLPNAKPIAIDSGTTLELQSGGMSITLTMPESTTVEAWTCDPANVRVATMYSLVVNKSGERYAEALDCVQIGTETITNTRKCDIEVLDQLPENPIEEPKQNRHPQRARRRIMAWLMGRR